MLKDLLIKDRSCRRFYGEEKVSIETLKDLVDTARYCASARNSQPLRFLISNETATNAQIFSTIRWGGFLKERGLLKDGEEPAAYIVIVGDKAHPDYLIWDAGIASQTLKLAIAEKGLASCMIAAFEKDKLKELLSVPEKYQMLLVLAIGKAKENVILDEAIENEVKYWRDEENVLHIPKRKLEDILLKIN